MEFIDLNKQYRLHKANIDSAIQRVLNHGQFVMGPEIYELENRLAEFCGAKYCVSCSSGTDALLLSLLALGIGNSDEVILPAFSFFATAEVVLLLGAKPIFVDIESKTFNIDPDKIEEKITKKTKAIIAVSLFGQCADITKIQALTTMHGNIPIIEDAAQSFGATHFGKHSCNLSTIGCTSFFPSKPLGCYGDGGACFTNNPQLAEKLQCLRVHGQQSRYHHTMLGINGRLDTIQAAILLEKLSFFPDELRARLQVAEKYDALLKNCDHISLPNLLAFNTSVYAQFTLRTKSRDKLIESLKNAGVPTAIHYPSPLHKQPISSTNISLPESEKASLEVLSIPFHPYLSDQEIEKVCDVISKWTLM